MSEADGGAGMSQWGEESTAGPPPVAGYDILRSAGRGGMAEVYVARQLTLGRLVALKFLTFDPGADEEHRVARFRREAELMAKVSHPNILSVFDFGIAAGRPFLVLEYVEGGSLRQRMQPGEPMPVAQVLAILKPVGDALTYLHRQGILHRDLKPENILMHGEGNPKVSDFGIAVLRAGVGALTQTGRGLGTLGYVAPEQHYRLSVDERADQYSLAALAYEMLTGQKALGTLKPPSQWNPALGPPLDEVLLRALDENPTRRFPSIPAFLEAFEGSVSEPRARRSRWPVWAAGTAAVVALIVALGVAAVHRPSAPAPGMPALSSPPSTPRPPAEPAPVTQEQIIQLKAYLIWVSQGRPMGVEGEQVREKNWQDAKDWVEKELQLRAFKIWQEGGSPTGAAGEAVKEKNWHQAECQLYEELKQQAAEADRNAPAAPLPPAEGVTGLSSSSYD